ncbi:hypothetical protein PIB30_022560 [Stylosanthes scabra]|uniref:BHLH domain-containing protein n=1 Tax=Stylosanthes scabra TaxID=79078 RepID=A0ABU6Y7W1_9FABA|nr:hypothetical protein [Stylosanthes scabra]
MALKAVVYPQTQDPSFLYGLNYNDFHHNEQDPTLALQTYYASEICNNNNNNNTCSSPPELLLATDLSNTSAATRPKRRRAKSRKNKEQIENQRMTHIAVERNRRKQMNHYLSVLRSLMPDSYVQRGDQASIIGGAINFVKELEQKLQFLGATHHHQHGNEHNNNNTPFSEFFTFPQYTTTTTSSNNGGGEGGCDKSPSSSPSSTTTTTTVVGSGGADIEVTMVESHANVKIRSKKKPKQLLKMVSALQTMSLTILHLNVTTTINQFVLYSLSLKVEDDCKLGSVDDIAAAVYQLMNSIQQQAPTIFN